VNVEPTHVPAAHTVELLQSLHTPPAPHWPSVPQLEGALAAQSSCGSVPTVTLAQVPFGAPVSERAHALHEPVHALPQQKPSTQKPLAHSSLAVHAVPVASRGMQALPLQ